MVEDPSVPTTVLSAMCKVQSRQGLEPQTFTPSHHSKGHIQIGTSSYHKGKNPKTNEIKSSSKRKYRKGEHNPGTADRQIYRGSPISDFRRNMDIDNKL